MQAVREDQDPVTKEGKSSPATMEDFFGILSKNLLTTSLIVHKLCTWTDPLQHQFVLVCLISRRALSSEIPKPHYVWEKKNNLLAQEAEFLNHTNSHNIYMRANFHKSLNPVQHFLKCLNNETGQINISVLLQPSDLRKWNLPSVLGRRLHVFLPCFCKTRKPNSHSSFDR